MLMKFLNENFEGRTQLVLVRKSEWHLIKPKTFIIGQKNWELSISLLTRHKSMGFKEVPTMLRQLAKSQLVKATIPYRQKLGKNN